MAGIGITPEATFSNPVLFDLFFDRVYWVLVPSGIFVCVIGFASAGFFRNFEKQEASAHTNR